MACILITGGAGFIGSRLAAALIVQGHKVRILDTLSPQIHGADARAPAWTQQPAVTFLQGSVTDKLALTQILKGVDAVVHLAAETGTGQSMYEIARYNEVNTQGTALMMDIMVSMGEARPSRVVLTSSRSIYGEGAYDDDKGQRCFPAARSAASLARHEWDPRNNRSGRKLTAAATRETDPPQPASIYAATKYAQEDLVRIACESTGVGYAILRLQNVYGEGQSLNNPYTGILSIFSTRIRMGKVLPLFEDGLETRDFVHVDDVVSAIVRCLETDSPPNTTINVGSGIATSVLDVATELSRALNKPVNVQVTGEYRLGDIRHNWADISRLRDVLGLKPTVYLADGLKRFADWVSTQPLPDDGLDRANAELRARNLMGQ